MAEYTWIPLTEEEVYRNAGMGDLWDMIQAGDPMALLLKRRLDAGHEAMRPELEKIARKAFGIREEVMPDLMLAGPKNYAMFEVAVSPGFWAMDWRKRKRLLNKAARARVEPPKKTPFRLVGPPGATPEDAEFAASYEFRHLLVETAKVETT